MIDNTDNDDDDDDDNNNNNNNNTISKIVVRIKWSKVYKASTTVLWTYGGLNTFS